MPVPVNYFDTVDGFLARHGGMLAADVQASPYDRAAWFALHRDHLATDAAPLIAVATGTGATTVALPLYITGRRARPLASWYTLAFRPILASPHANAIPQLTAIARDLRHRLDVIDLSPVPVADGTADSIATALHAAGWRIEREDAGANWVATVEPGGFESYWRRRPSRLRNTVSRKNKAAALDHVLHRHWDDAAWRAYEGVQASSWKPAEGSPAFLRAMAQQAAADGSMRLGLAYERGVPVAAQFWTIDGATATIHKLHYRADRRDASPGTLLSAFMFREIITHDPVTTIDFGTGDDGYKRDWMDECRALAHIRCFNPRRAGGAMAWLRAGASRFARCFASKGESHG